MLWVRVQEIRRPVQGVDDPEWATVPAREPIFDGLVALFREYLMTRMIPHDDRERSLLGVEVGLRHVIGPCLLSRINEPDLARVTPVDLHRRLGRIARGLEKCV